MTVPSDPGLQLERTGLAWTRTALGVVGTAGLVLRYGVVEHDPVTIAAAVSLLTLGAVVALVGWRRPVRLHAAVRDGRTPVDLAAIRVTAAAAALAAVGALFAVLR